MSSQGVPPPIHDPLPETRFSKGAFAKKKYEQVQQIEYFYEKARTAKGSNRQMWLVQVLDRGMEYSSKCKEREKTAQPVREACGYALQALRAAGERDSGDPAGQRPHGPNYKTEAVLYAPHRKVDSRFGLAYAHGDAAAYRESKRLAAGFETDAERLDAIAGIATNLANGAGKVNQLKHNLQRANLWQDGITEQPAVMARAAFQKDYVLYLRKQLRKKFEVRFADRDGTVARANQSRLEADLPLIDGQHMFAMRTKIVNNEERVSFCAADHMLGASPKEQGKFARELGLEKGTDFDNLFFNHSSFFKGKPVTCAGILEIQDNRIVDINNATGHYRPTAEDLHQAVKYIHESSGELPENMTATQIRPVNVKGKETTVLVRWSAREFLERGPAAAARYSEDGNTWKQAADLPDDLRHELVWEPGELHALEPRGGEAPKIGARRAPPAAAAVVAAAAAPQPVGAAVGNG